MRRLLACLAAPLALLTGCCGYRFSQDLPEGIATLHVEAFANATPYAELEFELTRVLEQELRRRGARLTGPGTADAILSGAITDYLPAAAVSVETSGRVLTRQVVVTVDWTLAPRGGGAPRAGAHGARGTEIFTPSSTGGGEGTARREAMRELAQAIADRVYGSW